MSIMAEVSTSMSQISSSRSKADTKLGAHASPHIASLRHDIYIITCSLGAGSLREVQTELD
jgi:hypothetical protein